MTRMLRRKSQLCGKDDAFGLRCVAWSCLWEVDGRWVSAAGNVVGSWEINSPLYSCKPGVKGTEA